MSIWGMLKYMLSGIGITFELVPLCVIATFLIGLFLGIVMYRKIPVINFLTNIYKIAMRGVPAIVVLRLLFYSVNLSSAFFAAFLSLTLYHSAYIGEIIRGCFEAVPKGQMEAGKSLGLGYWKIMIKIYIPQIYKQLIPALCGQYILLVKDTTLVYVVGVRDMMWMGRQLMSMTFDPITGYLLIGIVYYIVCSCIELIGHFTEKRTSYTVKARRLSSYY